MERNRNALDKSGEGSVHHEKSSLTASHERGIDDLQSAACPLGHQPIASNNRGLTPANNKFWVDQRLVGVQCK